MPKISLIVPTVDRAEPLERLFASLAAQSHRDLEVLLIDQNGDDRLAGLVTTYGDRITIRRITSDRGLSKARNAGLAAATGDIVGFPDDDCWFPEATLARIAALFDVEPTMSGVTGRACDDDGRSAGSAHWDLEPGPVAANNVWRRGCSITIFLRREVAEQVGGFDESLGAGATTGYGAGEETDYLLRALALPGEIRYLPDLIVHHAASTPAFDIPAAQRATRYGRGIGCVLRRHRFPLPMAAAQIGRSFAGAGLFAIRGDWRRARFYWSSGSGKLTGFLRPVAPGGVR